MQAPNSNTVKFRCGLAGVVSKQSPDLLSDGQYRSLLNVVSTQEGSISSRTGIKQVGSPLGSGLPTCYFVRKLVVQRGENPLVPATNPRYLGILTGGGQRNIYRTFDYNSLDNGGGAVVTGADTAASKHWEMADYSAGSSGSPWAYFGCPSGMFKDSGLAPFNTLPKWGIPPAVGACLAAVVVGTVAISGVTFSLDTWPGVVVTLATDVALSDFDTITIAGMTGVTFQTTDGRTSPNDTWDVRIGVPDASFTTFSNKTKQFRLFDRNGQAVQATGAYTSGATVTGVPVSGNLDGGAESSPNATQPYDYVMAYEETSTGDYGNPSQFMSDVGTATLVNGGITYSCQPVKVHGGQVKVVVWGTADSRIGFIRLYRRGGSFTDAQGRLIARVPNPGSEAAFIVLDNISDPDVEFNELWQTDNDPPVTSTPPTPIKTTASGSIAAGWTTVALSGSSPFATVTVGTRVHIIDPTGTSEDVYASAIPSTASFRAYFQFAHASGVQIEVDAITGQPCNLVVTIGEAVVVAGDPNNPHIMRKSKNGAPQAFPVGTDAAGAVTEVAVGTPANSIVNMTECRGQVFSMNVANAFEVAIIRGSFQEPAKVSNKGLRGQSGFCKTPTEEVWYLSDDGVYSWNGSSFRKRSELIDNLFHGQMVNGMSPIDMTKTDMVRMVSRRGVIRLLYTDLANNVREVACEPMYGDRWVPLDENEYEPPVNPPEYPITMMYCEPDTQSLIVSAANPLVGATFGIADAVKVTGGTNFTSDWWTSAGTEGAPITWDIRLPWFDMGNPAMMKLFEEVWLDIDPQLTNAVYSFSPSITVELLLNYSDTAVETFQIAIPTGNTLAGRQLISLLPNLLNTSGSIYQSYGREARAISFHLSGLAFPVQMTLYQLVFRYQEVGELTAGAASDWMDLGSKHDKRLYQMAVVFDSSGTDRELVLETRGGREGQTAGAPQVFKLSSPTDLGSGRCMKVFPLADPTVGKLIRVRPYAAASISGGKTQSSVDLFRVLDVTFPDAEEYPPDIVSRAGAVANGKVTEPWTTGGYDYDKYCNQISFEVNTNGVGVTVQPQADGANVGPSFVITATDTDRKRNITVPSNLKGKSWSLFVDPTQAALTSGNGMWQLFSLSWKFRQADKGEVGHTDDWDDLGHPYDKLLITLTVEWENTGGANVTLQLDTLTGIDGQTVNSDIMVGTPIVLLAGGRGKKTFPLPADTIAKMIRLYPKGNSIPVAFKQWKYSFDKVNYPADIIHSTPWKSAVPVDKDPSWLWIDADTNGIAATVTLQSESGTVMTVNHTGTANNRKKNYPMPVDTRAKMWRLAAAEGTNGRFQLFDWGFEHWEPFALSGPMDPPEIVLATPWNEFGYPYPKLARTLIVTINTGGAACNIALQTNEGGTVANFSVTTTYTTRRVTLSCPPNLEGTMWRLVFTPSALAQLWDWSLDAIKMPPAMTAWSTYGQGFGYKGWKFMSQFWLDYICLGAISVTLASDTGSITFQMPAHSSRAVERCPSPSIAPAAWAVWGAGLNKSKLYSITLSAVNPNAPFQVFSDMSGIEWMPCGGDRHAAYQQTPLSEFMGVGV